MDAKPTLVKRFLRGLAYAAVLAGYALSVGRGLDRREFWTDEAETAILAKGILEHGIPTLPTDDSIHYPFQLGWATESGVWLVTPWLDEYVAAASFRLFGVRAWSARLPFLLMALGAAACVMRVAHLVDARHRTALFCGAAFLFSLPSLALSWQVRYYAASMFAQGLLLLGVYWGAQGRRVRGALLLAAGLSMQFHTNYIPLAVNVGCLLAVATLRWKANRDLALAVWISFGLLAIAAAPWILYAGSAMRASVSEVSVLFSGGADDASHGIAGVLRNLLFYADVYAEWLPMVLLLALGAVGALRRARGRGADLVVDPGSSAVRWTLWLLLPLSLAAMSATPLAMPRYVLPFVPAFCLLLGLVLFETVRSTGLQAAIAGLVFLTGAAVRPFQPTEWIRRSPAFAVVASLASEAPRRATALADHFRERSRCDDRLLTLVDDLPLHFYVDGRVRPAQRWDPSSDAPPAWIAPQRFGQTSDEAFGPPFGPAAEWYEREFLDVELEDPEVQPEGVWRRRTCLYRRRAGQAAPAVARRPEAPSGYPVYLLKGGDPSVVARLSPVEEDPHACRTTLYKAGRRDPSGLRLRRSAASREILLGGGWRLETGREYEIRFRGRSDPPRRIGLAVVAQEPPAREFGVEGDVALDREWSWHRVGFAAETDTERGAIDFLIGGAEGVVDVAEAEIVWVAH